MCFTYPLATTKDPTHSPAAAVGCPRAPHKAPIAPGGLWDPFMMLLLPLCSPVEFSPYPAAAPCPDALAPAAHDVSPAPGAPAAHGTIPPALPLCPHYPCPWP